MPLSPSPARREIHHRSIDMRAWQREDGLFDVEAHLIDTKPFSFPRMASSESWPAGKPLHDLWVRLTLDKDFVVQAAEAASDTTPFDVCKEAPGALSVLVGERIARGWSSRVKELLRGAAGCTHLTEMLIPMGTTALQGIHGIRPDRKAQIRNDERKIDSCYAYGKQRELVRMFWPDRYQPEPQDSPK